MRSRPIGVGGSHVTMKRNDQLDLFTGLKQWWLWGSIAIASTAFSGVASGSETPGLLNDVGRDSRTIPDTAS